MALIAQPTRRIQILLWLLVLVGGLFVVRLYYLQVVKHTYYETEGYKEHLSKFTIPAKRGLIYATDDQGMAPLVLNEPAYTVYADPRYVTDVGKTADALRRIAGGNVVDGLETLLGDKQRQYVVIAKQLNEQQANLLKQENLPGVGMQQQERRVYPEGNLAAQLLGYVNADGQGQYGVEAALNDQLTGKTGLLKAVTDVRGIPISISNNDVQIPAQDGDNVLLTIDRNVQAYAEQALQAGVDKAKAKHGSIIVMDPRSGAVLAMANLPSYDPSQYDKVSDYSVFSNPVVNDPYEPGSVMKTLTMATGLNEGAVTKDSTFTNTDSVTVDGDTISNAEHVGGQRSMTEVLQYSLNTGVVHVLQQLGGGSVNLQARSKLYDYFTNHFMLAKQTGIEQSPEAIGKIFPPTDPQGNNVRYANMSFGQGMNVTMLQVIAAFSAVINGGTYYKPHLVAATFKDPSNVQMLPPQIVKANLVKQSTTDQLKDMTRIAREKALPGADKPGYYIGGKTGTSQVIDPKTGKYTDQNAIGSYLGFGGGNDGPRYVIMVRVTDSQLAGFAGGGGVATIL